MRDLKRWLDYVDMSENEFDNIADNFRDQRVWSKDKNGKWIKDNIWNYENRRNSKKFNDKYLILDRKYLE